MEQPVLEKMILAKFGLPAEVQKEIKKYLQAPTPTARLMKSVIVEWFESGSSDGDWVRSDQGPDLREYQPHARWTNPPLRPAIIILHRYGNRSDWNEYFEDRYFGAPEDDDDDPVLRHLHDDPVQRYRVFDSAGEPLAGRHYKGLVKFSEPCGEHWYATVT